MKNFVQRKLKEQKGMTLIELLAVIVIIAIIAAIAIPAIGNIIENSRYSAVKSDGLNVIAAAQIYFTENAQEPSVTIEDLKKDGFLETSGKLTSGNVAKPTTGALTLTAGPFEFSGGKEIEFKGATVAGINADTQKGSNDTINAIAN
ncbi:prepilin-type N-terminal cleavage/methylation domain-containing protein [Planococcus sp. APC 3900]|uniref:prepilin-type N-terminal cleavage/methylation domain-containing protein n=1 Tax=Planococcus sp. APC 3900 TaxID=3035191 RepID=UPI0025B47970|nr:prepilin-type N-terminal cleavage/methylation domain-containing protein [Planococcus sp. APC 3900]MDN3438194.1 prepilin-type N-terminal cleavage/methylation domain-containing protein [Planococcus sp. APC 3900]